MKAQLGKTETPKKHKSTASKLALNMYMKSMLCTTFCVGEKEAGNFMSKVTADTASGDNADGGDNL